MSVYSGFPGCINGMNALKEVLERTSNKGIKDDIGKSPSYHNENTRLNRGEHELTKLDSTQVEKLKRPMMNFPPAWSDLFWNMDMQTFSQGII